MKGILVLFVLLLALCVAATGCGKERGDETQATQEGVASTDSYAGSVDSSASSTDSSESSVDSGEDTTVSTDEATDSSNETTDSSNETTDSGNEEPSVPCQHVCGRWEITIAPTCTKEGVQRTECDNCGEEISATVPQAPHTEEVLEGREPTCSMEGLTEGIICSLCDKVIERQKGIATIPHTEKRAEAKAPTCTQSGLTGGTECSVCKAAIVKQDRVDPLGHEYVDGFCKRCGDEKNVVADKIITIATGGVSDYVVVYDDGDVRATELAEKFVSYMKSEHRITIESVAYSDGTDSQKCIYIGDLPQAGRVKKKLNAYNDFGACVSGDDYVMYATDSRLYEYLFELLKMELSDIRGGEWQTGPGRNLIYHNTEYAEKSYVDYVIENNGGRLTLDVLMKLFEARTFVAEDGTTLAYRLYVPYGYDKSKEYPVLMFMHGAGERGNDNEGNMKHMPLNWFSLENSPFWDCIVIAPQCPNGQQWVDTPWAEGGYRVEDVPESNEMRAAMEILDMVERDFPTDLDRYYVAGLSMGGFGTWDMIMRYPERFAAAVPLCGGGDYTQAYKLLNMPIYTIHDKGDYTVPFGGTKEMVVALESMGGQVIFYEEVKGYGHNVWDYASRKAEIWTWLFEQTREDR